MRRSFAAILLASSLSLTACQSSSGTTSSPAEPSSARPATSNQAAAADSGLDPCALDSLPKEATETVASIHSGGPYVARKDGSTFGNRERVLPLKPQGFYREYTVETPGSSDRGARRVVTGGNPKKHPSWYFYTDDHYGSFCQITGAD